MKHHFTILLLILPLIIGNSYETAPAMIPETVERDLFTMGNKMKVGFGDKSYLATLSDNPSATAFKALLPLTVRMRELNNNEKFFKLSKNIPSNDSNPGTINSGDLMLWESNTLVVFYETFSTSFNYTRLGKIDNPTGLAEALGSGDVTVTFKLR